MKARYNSRNMNLPPKGYKYKLTYRKLGINPRKLGLTVKQLEKCKDDEELATRIKSAGLYLLVVANRILEKKKEKKLASESACYVYNRNEKKELEEKMRKEGTL